MNATAFPSGDTRTFESRAVGENQRSSWSFHSVRTAPPAVQTLIALVFPFADPSAHSSEPSAVNWTELGLPTTGTHEMSPPDTDTTPSRRSAAPPATTPLLLPTTRMRSPLKARSPGSAGRPLPLERNAIHWPSREKTGLDAVFGVRPVTGRCVLRSSDAIQICPPRVKAIVRRSFDSVKLPASERPPDTRAAFGDVGDTVHSAPSFEKRISVGDTQEKDATSDVRMSGSTGKSVSATGFWPGETTNRSCLPQESQRKATIFPSGDQAGADGYLMCEMRSMVMLPRGVSAAAGIATKRHTASPMIGATGFIGGLSITCRALTP